MFGSLTSKAMASAAGAIAAVGFASLLGGAVTAASDLNETINKSNVIFGTNARQVRAWSQDSARSFGLSQQAALDAAAGLGNMLTQLGYTGKAAAATSENTVKLAADLGSFNNLETGDVLERIGGALRGEYDSLQLLIPNINAARVEQEAMAATGKANADALTAQEKAAAVLAIVQRDGAAAADDFAETSDGLANSQKILTAEWHDAQAKLGALLVGPMTDIVHFATGSMIPAFETIVDVTGDAVDIFTDLPGPLQAAVGVLGGIALLRGPLSSTFETLALKALYAKDAIADAATNVGTLKSALGKLAGAAATLATITVLAKAVGDVIEFTNAGDDARETVDNLSDSLAGLEGPELIDANKVALQQLRKELEGYQDILDDYNNESILHYLLIGQFSADDVGSAKEAIRVLKDEIERLQGASAAAAGTIPLLGNAVEATVAQSEEAQKALDEWLKHLQGIAEGFVQPLSTYQDLLSQKQQAERDSAQATADATADSTDSWEDFATDVDVSLSELAASLQTQLDNQAEWRTNLGLIAQWAGADVAQYLAEMGADGIQIVADMADGTTAGAQAMREQILREIQAGGAEWTASMDSYMKIMEALGSEGGANTVQGLARELGLGVDIVRGISDQFGLNLAEGINPVLSALGKQLVRPGNGPNFASLATGGWTGPGGKYTPVGIVHGDEYVEPKESLAYYGKGIFEALHRRSIPRDMLASLTGYASGGFVSPSDVPHPPSTAPYRMPISTAGDATMQKGYDETVAWLAANLAPMSAGFGAAPGAASGSNQAIVQQLAASMYGWVGAQWNALYALIMKESGFRNTAQNPTSTAYGMFQFLDSTWAGYGVGKTSDPRLQTIAGLRYIDSRYGSPSAALGFHLAHNWYDDGGILPPGVSLAYNGTGKPETVRTAEQEAALRGASLEGAHITGTLQIGGDGLARLVDGRIELRDRSQARNARGWQ